ncbi:GNAT family N-acetyltransferase [Streptomyces avicenniae]|uniref:GNAT family N-acetyltransferase n=1 Tax=Streptomyces avicenniae TaxID=500153 RepID=UPI001CBA62D5|nr:GNAT family N-acetyltransferase [Streptomyces avicenniae]
MSQSSMSLPSTPRGPWAVRAYLPADEPSWLRCRVLSFLGTPYYDNVLPAKPPIAPPGFALVAVDAAGTVAGIMDVTVEEALATIETVAVHPDHQHRGIGRALLAEARGRVRALGVGTLDAWTRDAPDTLRWYRAMGFAESDHYVHVYADDHAAPGETGRAIGAARPGLAPVTLHLHGALAEEETLRKEFTRVYVCRRFALTP